LEYFELIRQRHSVRSYRPDPVEPEKLQKILEAARLAPTAANRQAFKVIVFDTYGRKEEVYRMYGREWLGEAPLILAVCSIPKKCWVRSDKKCYSDVDAAIVMDHMILAATELGLGTCWVAAFDTQAARDVLQLDDAWEPVALTPLGYARETAFPKLRKPLEDIVVNR